MDKVSEMAEKETKETPTQKTESEAENLNNSPDKDHRLENSKDSKNNDHHQSDRSRHLKEHDHNLTMSTKLSTDNLICKSPRNSIINGDVKSVCKSETRFKYCGGDGFFYLGSLQILFGVLMAVFGVLTLVHDANLAQVGAGIWGGIVAVITGAVGLLSSSTHWCPLRETPKRMAHTVFLALSLISLAIAQLVVVVAATGLARDIYSLDRLTVMEGDTVEDPFVVVLPPNYQSLLAGAALVAVSAVECLCAGASAYRAARECCPCFRPEHRGPELNNRHQLVTSWLGRHGAGQVYLVPTDGSEIGRGSKLSSGLPVPIFAIPPPIMQPPVIRVPLIPAPLGPVPSPILPPITKEMFRRKRRPRQLSPTSRSRSSSRRSRKQQRPPKERAMTEADAVRTYTGLDRTIAEEFIDICDSRNASLCSESGGGASLCGGGEGRHSDVGSRNFLVGK